MKFAIALVVGTLAIAGCTTTGAVRRATAREAQVPHFHPASAVEPLLAFQSAVLLQYQTGGMEAESFAAIMGWIGAGLTVLRGPHPDDWETVARGDWQRVRSMIGPFEGLSPFVRLIGTLLE